MNHTDIVKLPLTCNSLVAYLIDESLLVYSQKTQNVYGFEKGDAALFLQVDELVSNYSCVKIAEKFPDLDATLLEQMYDLAIGIEADTEIEYQADRKLGTYTKDTLTRIFYQIDNIVFAIHYPNDILFKRLHPVFKYLHIEKPDNITAKTRISVDFFKSSDLWGIHWNNMPVEMTMPEARLATYIQEKMMTSAYQAQRYLIALHAGSVEKNGNVIIMPAVAESGKTTLTAALISHGSRLFSDEVTALDYEGYVHPLPFCMNIKEGSWRVLAPMYPHLVDSDTYNRFDGQNIRFLPPENMHIGCQKASHIIFPKYIPDAKTILTQISVNEALFKIKEAGYQIQESMDGNKFELILNHLVSLPKYTLVYSNLDEAIVTIDRLLET